MVFFQSSMIRFEAKSMQRWSTFQYQIYGPVRYTKIIPITNNITIGFTSYTEKVFSMVVSSPRL